MLLVALLIRAPYVRLPLAQHVLVRQAALATERVAEEHKREEREPREAGEEVECRAPVQELCEHAAGERADGGPEQRRGIVDADDGAALARLVDVLRTRGSEAVSVHVELLAARVAAPIVMTALPCAR